LNNPIIAACTQHTFCRACVTGLEDCPCCRAPAQPLSGVPVIVSNLLSELKIQCNTFGTNMKRGQFQSHKQSHCIKQCSYCGTNFIINKMEEHIGVCPSLVVPCCAGDVGCEHRCKRSAMEKHEKTCEYMARRDLLLKIKDLEYKYEQDKQEWEQQREHYQRKLEQYRLSCFGEEEEEQELQQQQPLEHEEGSQHSDIDCNDQQVMVGGVLISISCLMKMAGLICYLASDLEVVFAVLYSFSILVNIWLWCCIQLKGPQEIIGHLKIIAIVYIVVGVFTIIGGLIGHSKVVATFGIVMQVLALLCVPLMANNQTRNWLLEVQEQMLADITRFCNNAINQ